MTPVFKSIKNDKGWYDLAAGESEKIAKHLQNYKTGDELLHTIKKPRKVNMVSAEQHRYYFGVIVTMLCQDWYGSEDKEDMKAVHEGLKIKFLSFPLEKGLTGVLSTKALSTAQMEDYMKAIRTWASVECNVYIPLPNEVEGMWN